MEAQGLSDIGMARANNEDALLCMPAQGLFAIADGVGGKEHGEIASQVAIKLITEKFDSDEVISGTEEDRQMTLREAFYEANHQIYQAGLESGSMNTTLTAVLATDKSFYIVHVGDCRVYLIDDDDIVQLTSDHSLVYEMVSKGEITLEEALHHHQRHVITRALGSPLIKLDDFHYNWDFGDRLLLCSDGLYNFVADAELLALVRTGVDLAQTAADLVELANSRGGYDNITVILVVNDGKGDAAYEKAAALASAGGED